MRRFPALIALIASTAAFAPASSASASSSASSASASAASADAAWVWPVRGEVISPYRNGADPYASGQHRGIDIGAAVGTPVVAASGGDVRFAGTAGSSGLTIGIRTSDGYDTSYLHLSSLAVRAGTRVSAGERIGAVGTTGTRSATAPHLHFGVRDAGTRYAYHDPLAFLPAPPAAPAPKLPAPAPAPAPEPASPALDPVPAPLATAPAARPEAWRLRRPAALPRLPRSAPAPWVNGIPAAPIDHGPLQRRVAEPGLNRRPAAGPGASVHRLGDARGEARPARTPTPSTRSGAPRQAGPATGSPHTAEAVRQEATSREPGGPDIGWMLACGGLLLAAAILGLSDDRRRSTRPARSALARLRMPLQRG